MLALGNLALGVVEHLAFHEDDGVVIPDGALEQTLGVGRRGRCNDLEARHVGIPALEGLGMLRSELQRRTTGPPEHDGTAELPARHVPDLGRAVDYLVYCEQREVPGHHLDDRAQPNHRRAHANAGKAQFGDGSVDDSPGPEFLQQPAAHLVGAVVFGHFLAHEEDVVVPLQFLAQRLIQRVTVCDCCHQFTRLSTLTFRLQPDGPFPLLTSHFSLLTSHFHSRTRRSRAPWGPAPATRRRTSAHPRPRP